MPLQRLIPILLLDDNQQVIKTKKFKNRVYIGDPLVALRLFNDLSADELMVFSIGDGSYRSGSPPWDVLEEISGEALMPLAYGGCIGGADDAARVISLGYEKVVYSASRLFDGTNVSEVVHAIGSQSVSVCVNYTESRFLGRTTRCHKSGKKLGRLEEVTHTAASNGVGEIILQNISREGGMQGLDLEVITEVSPAFVGPVVVTGGMLDLDELSGPGAKNISGIAAGSFFVFSGKRRGVLISYPDDVERKI
jgi:imidazole glycerol-phosphate synthase subunit HisF